ncbi:hypothetical protein R3P38DRAFT_2803802 [Favolaschia claudopus]|uniref:Uncharacterized protein n=1 Tax=Favolaschia claudopus TaxID=2862362 RepID=A0AAV9ZRR8_9AGAR
MVVLSLVLVLPACLASISQLALAEFPGNTALYLKKVVETRYLADFDIYMDSPDLYKRATRTSPPLALAPAAARITHRNILFNARCNARASIIYLLQKGLEGAVGKFGYS